MIIFPLNTRLNESVHTEFEYTKIDASESNAL